MCMCSGQRSGEKALVRSSCANRREGVRSQSLQFNADFLFMTSSGKGRLLTCNKASCTLIIAATL